MDGIAGFRTATALDPPLSWNATGALASLLEPATSLGRSLHAQARQARRPPSAPRSFAQQFAFFSDPDLVAEIVGEAAIRRRSHEQFDYVTDRVELGATRPPDRQLAAGHLLSFFGHTTVTQWRQLAHVHGSTLCTPFKTRSLVELASSIPASERYAQGSRLPTRIRQKHLLKDLLERRVPGYETDKRKANGAYPRRRLFEDGCLQSVFDRYDPPAFLPSGLVPTQVERYGALTWTLITFALWRDRIVENPSLDLLDGCIDVRIE
ncbi:asparagine synthase-related protein [Haloarculaceae archaeon H-GB2-1]|nr:asparagine synthase-related protein [Haloarculaceae archaeon H-GB2-1]